MFVKESYVIYKKIIISSWFDHVTLIKNVGIKLDYVTELQYTVVLWIMSINRRHKLVESWLFTASRSYIKYSAKMKLSTHADCEMSNSNEGRTTSGMVKACDTVRKSV